MRKEYMHVYACMCACKYVFARPFFKCAECKLNYAQSELPNRQHMRAPS